MMQVMPVIVARKFFENFLQFVDDHLDRAVAHRVNTELPAQFVCATSDGVESLRGNPNCTGITGSILIFLERPVSRCAEPAVDAHLDCADSQAIVAETGNEAEAFHLGDGDAHAFLEIIERIESGPNTDLQGRPGKLVAMAVVKNLEQAQIVRPHARNVDAGDAGARKLQQQLPQFFDRFVVAHVPTVARRCHAADQPPR